MSNYDQDPFFSIVAQEEASPEQLTMLDSLALALYYKNQQVAVSVTDMFWVKLVQRFL